VGIPAASPPPLGAASVGVDDDLVRAGARPADELLVGQAHVDPEPDRAGQVALPEIEVVVYTYGRGAELWWTRSRNALDRVRNLRVMSVPAAAVQELAKLAQRTMQLQCTIQDGHVWLGDDDGAVEVALTTVASPLAAAR
jgi:uncharacterized protein YaeQ